MPDDYPSQIDKTCAEIIVEVMEAARSPSAAGSDGLYGALCAKIDAAIRVCEVERFPVDTTMELLYPLVALADEMFMTMPQYRARWIAKPLQLRYFGEVATGTVFFARLEELMAAPDGKKRQLELYFTCLALGFKGVYGVGGQGGLRATFESLGAMLGGMRSDGRGAQAHISRRGAHKKFLSLGKSLLAAFSLLVIAAVAVYLPSLVDFLEFLENFS